MEMFEHHSSDVFFINVTLNIQSTCYIAGTYGIPLYNHEIVCLIYVEAGIFQKKHVEYMVA